MKPIRESPGKIRTGTKCKRAGQSWSLTLRQCSRGSRGEQLTVSGGVGTTLERNWSEEACWDLGPVLLLPGEAVFLVLVPTPSRGCFNYNTLSNSSGSALVSSNCSLSLALSRPRRHSAESADVTIPLRSPLSIDGEERCSRMSQIPGPCCPTGHGSLQQGRGLLPRGCGGRSGKL